MNKEVNKFIEILKNMLLVEYEGSAPWSSEEAIDFIDMAIDQYKEQKESEGQELDFSKPKEVTGL